MQTQGNTISFNGQNIYVGLDTHLKSWKVTIMMENSMFKTFTQNPSPKELARYLNKTFPDGNYYSAYEASFCGFSIHRELEKLGIHNIVVNPADIPTTDKERKQKEDKRDSRKIVRSLSANELEGIYVPSEKNLEFRGFVRYRKTLVKEISRNKNRVKSLLYFYGIPIPEELNISSKNWSGRFTQWLRSINLIANYGKMILDILLDTTEYLRMQLLKADRELRAAYKEGEYSKGMHLIRSVPGIGLIASATFLSEIEDIHRFKNLDTLSSFVGLVPTTHSTGDKDVTGEITPRCNKPLRNILIEAAWISLRNDPALALAFNNLCKRMKKNEAIIRIAKKLLNRIRYVMKNEKEYVYGIV